MNRTDVHISPIDESYVRIETDFGIMKELQMKYTFKPPGFMFMPAYKAGYWDGTITLIQQGRVLKGLVPSIIDTCESSGYSVSVDKSFSAFAEPIPFDHKDLKLPFEPYDYQLAAVNRILSKKRQIVLSATGSGKSLILYMAVRALSDAKILIIVPTISLVHQLVSDFADYSVNNGWDADAQVHKICEGASKVTDKDIIVATWQSLQNIKSNAFFSEFDAVICDEVHTAGGDGIKPKVIQRILDACSNSFIRLGLTGTLSDSFISELVLIGMFGPTYRVSSTKDLMDRGLLTDLAITAIVLKYPKSVCDAARGLPYKAELDIIVKSQRRLEVVSKISGKAPGNTLVLFTYVEHGRRLVDEIKKHTEKQVFMVYGGTDSDQRENIRKICEQRDDVVICASSQIFSTGVNIKNLHNIVFAHPTKAKIRTLQSIGRGLRKHDSKQICNVYDICDDLRTGKKPNYAMTHFVDRMKIYAAEKFKVKHIEINL